MEKEIARKLAGYKQQDKKNDIYGASFFVTLSEVTKMFEKSEGRCSYCSVEMKTSYIQKDPLQWTLDRIDNQMGHNRGNIVLACLACNLKRRNICSNKFRFTKQLKVVCIGKPEQYRHEVKWNTVEKLY